jgi:putative endonuclease
MREYWVYMLRCSDESYYVGVTNNLQRRLSEHRSDESEGSYVYKRLPFTLVYSQEFQWILDAIAWEKQIKRWTRKKKEALIQGDQEALERLASRRGGRPR